MSVKIRVPGRLEVPTKLFGQFTFLDIIRLGLFSVLTYFLKPEPVLLGLSAVLGVIWYWWTPYGQHLDTLLYNLPRWAIEKKQLEDSQIKSKNDRYISLEDGSSTAVIEVSPTNLDMRTDSEQGALHNVYQNLLDTVNYPVHIHSLQQELSLKKYAGKIEENQIESKLSNNHAKKYLKEDYLEFCHELSERDLSATKHYIALRVEKNTGNWLLDLLPVGTSKGNKAVKSKLDNRCQEVIDTVNTADLQAERLTGWELKNTAERFVTGSKEDSSVLYKSPEPSPSWTSRRNGYSSPYHYRKTLYISEFPTTVELGWPLQLLRTDGLVDVTQVIEPRDTGKATKKLQRLSEKLNAEIDSFLSQGYRGTNKLETLLEDTEWILDLLADRQAQPVDYSAYITSHSESKAKTLQTHRQVKNRLETLQFQYGHTALRTDQAYKTQQPLLGDPLNETQLVPSTSAAAGFPFGTQQTNQEQGIIYGVDTSDDTPILADRFSWSSHSMARMGMVGSGKSYAAKLELLRSKIAYNNLQIIVVDPKKEYSQVIESIGGTTHILGERADFDPQNNDICFQVSSRGQQDNVEGLVDLVENIYYHTSRNEKKTLVLIDEARILMNDEEGRRVLNQFILEARDTNTAITLISQNASHFTYCREGREILDNMPGKVFMRHDRVPDSVVDYFQLSQQEKQELYELKTGTDSAYSEALLKISGRLDTRLKIESTQAEHRNITTGDSE
ncbi:helicase HerA domain-containing protein [Haloarcula argentinensis]|uniref:DUF87 domain-containing protein n=1 Tax=Haloarcula argentinensis TaxID=43776 RepID=A0A847UL42_HALAR|nr:DUF87 domain-containing protein [Haloarcula argentinensis]NLV13226.1 DUF87 domain-containing protein [Haloarcula argentinensis]